MGGQLEMISLLLSLGAKPAPALEYACGMTHSDVLLLLLDAGADPNTLIGQENMKEPLFYACFRSEHPLDNLRLLSQKGANLDAPSFDGKNGDLGSRNLFAMGCRFLPAGSRRKSRCYCPRRKNSQVACPGGDGSSNRLLPNQNVPEELQKLAARLKL